MNSQELAEIQMAANKNGTGMAAGLLGGPYGYGIDPLNTKAQKKEKPRLRYLRGQWMQITDRREQYYAKRKAHDAMAGSMAVKMKKGK